jgi:Sec-independent protein secretion pathway component TatC
MRNLLSKIAAGLRREAPWIAANMVVFVLYLLVSSTQWLEPSLRSEPEATGGVMAWTMITICFQVPLLVADLTWLTLTIRRGLRTRDWWAIPILLSVFVAWLLMFHDSASQLFPSQSS